MKFWSQTDGPGVGSPVFGGVAWTVTVDGGGVAWTGDGGGGAGAAADEVLSPLRGRTLADPCEASSNPTTTVIAATAAPTDISAPAWPVTTLHG
jgi:hypothetical protein